MRARILRGSGQLAPSAPEQLMRRALVVGCPDAGKTTLARCLSEKLALPLIHLDVHYWRPGWTPSYRDDWRARAAKLTDAPEWIMDGNFPDTFDIRMPHADSLVWLDYSPAICLLRVLHRRLKYASRARADLPVGCREGFDPKLIRFILWDFPIYGRRKIVEAIERFGLHLEVTRLCSDSDAEDFLSRLAAR